MHTHTTQATEDGSVLFYLRSEWIVWLPSPVLSYPLSPLVSSVKICTGVVGKGWPRVSRCGVASILGSWDLSLYTMGEQQENIFLHTKFPEIWGSSGWSGMWLPGHQGSKFSLILIQEVGSSLKVSTDTLSQTRPSLGLLSCQLLSGPNPVDS
jgi:hypothetical protein